MRNFGILLIFHVSSLLVRDVVSHKEGNVTIQDGSIDSKDIVPNLSLSLPMIAPLATTPSSNLVPAVTQSTPTLSNGTEFYVIGGSEVGRIFPWMVSITSNRDREHVCGGTLISTTSVLTSAFCLEHFRVDLKKSVVLLGTDNLSSTPRDFTVRKIIRIKYHEDFMDITNDIAIITLERPVPTGPNIQAVTLGTNKIIAGGTEATLVGWGKTEYSAMIPDQLRRVNVDVISNSDCSAKYQQYKQVKILPQQFCAGGSGRNSCVGDSGGPLMKNGVQIGIVSFITNCDTLPGVYTRVASYLAWINKNKTP